MCVFWHFCHEVYCSPQPFGSERFFLFQQVGTNTPEPNVQPLLLPTIRLAVRPAVLPGSSKAMTRAIKW